MVEKEVKFGLWKLENGEKTTWTRIVAKKEVNIQFGGWKKNLWLDELLNIKKTVSL